MSSWDVLGLTPGASVEEVRAAYRRLVMRVHPDRGGDPAEFRRVHEAAVACLMEVTSTGDGEPADEDGWPLRLSPPPPGFWERRVEPVLNGAFALGGIVAAAGVGYVVVVAVLTVAAMLLHAALVPILRTLTPG